MDVGLISLISNPPVDSITVNTALLAKNLDLIEETGASMINMMEKSVSPHLGQNIDIRI